MFDPDAYLTRIGMPARPTLDPAGLARLQLAHRLAIPFENLDVWLGRPIAIDGDSVFAKLVGARRGGYCFEQNRLFLDALSALGFEARALLARVWLGASAVPPLTHTLSLVMLDGQAWIADPGFGGSYTPPMPLVDGAQGAAPDGARFRLVSDADHGWMLLREGTAGTTDGRGGGEGFVAQYGFTLDPVFDADLAMGSHWSATAPASRFRRHRIVSIVLPRGFASLTDRRYRRHVGGTGTSAIIDDPRVYRLRLSLMFGIDLSAEELAVVFPPEEPAS
jgi:N-hydroxyarylamine O-acetyltransferase